MGQESLAGEIIAMGLYVGEKMDNQLSKLASNMSVQIGTLNVQLAQVQVENEDLKRRNAELQDSVNNLRKEVKKNESSGNHITNKQNEEHSNRPRS